MGFCSDNISRPVDLPKNQALIFMTRLLSNLEHLTFRQEIIGIIKPWN